MDLTTFVIVILCIEFLATLFALDPAGKLDKVLFCWFFVLGSLFCFQFFLGGGCYLLELNLPSLHLSFSDE